MSNQLTNKSFESQKSQISCPPNPLILKSNQLATKSFDFQLELVGLVWKESGDGCAASASPPKRCCKLCRPKATSCCCVFESDTTHWKKNVPRPSVFNDFDFQIALSPQRGAHFPKLNFQSAPSLPFLLRSRATASCKFCRAQLPRVLRQFLTILTSKSLSRHGVVQILRSSTSKSAPNMQRGARFCRKPLSRHSVVSRSSATPVCRSWLCEPSKPQDYGKTQNFAQFLPTKILMSRIGAVKHLCCQTSMLQDLAATFSIVGS